jgi:hypothetical protein
MDFLLTRYPGFGFAFRLCAPLAAAPVQATHRRTRKPVIVGTNGNHDLVLQRKARILKIHES